LFPLTMEKIIYHCAQLLLKIIHVLPLTWVARIGRAGGAATFWLDARHRRVALESLTHCFGREKSPAEIRALAKENFRRIGESYACGLRTAFMGETEIRAVLEVAGLENLTPAPAGEKPRSFVGAMGHFGNFELYARLNYFTAHQIVTTYRGLRQPALNQLFQSLRERSGCLYFDRRADGHALRDALNQPGILLGLLADQRTTQGSLRLPLFGRECLTSSAPAIFARRYRFALHAVVCYRVALARWRIEIGPEIPLRENGVSRSTEAVCLDVSRAHEAAIRRDPANWFWVHNRWKLPPPEPLPAKRETGE
jgi:lauroyl/myristoyl acyltransferase